MVNKLLTIIIPTYSRPERLNTSLGVLLPIANRFEEKVQILVNDNDSPDGTEDIVKRYIDKYPKLVTYHRQLENIGAGNNFFDGARRASTKYICLMGDDDIVTASYFDVVFEILELYPNLGWLNYNIMDVSYHGRFLGMRDEEITNRYYPEGSGLMKDHQETPSLMTSNVFLREDFLNVLDNSKPLDYPGYNWYYCILKAFIHKPSYYFGSPIAMDGKPDGGPDWSYKYPIYYFFGMGKMFKEFDKDVPGLYKAWCDRQFVPGYSNTENLLSIVANQREFYKGDNLKKILPYIGSEYYRKRFIWAVKYSSRIYNLRARPLQSMFGYIYTLLKPLKCLVR